MGMGGRVATWLELAVTPQRESKKSTVRVHSVGGKACSCFAITVDGRWVCAGNGDVTVFKGIGAALHFLEVLRVDAFEPGARADEDLLCETRHYCLKCDRRKGLQPCRRCRAPRYRGAGELPH